MIQLELIDAPSKRAVGEGTDRRLLEAEVELVRLMPGPLTYRFLEIHRANPHIWLAFLELAREALEVREHYSADTIYHTLRYYLDVRTFGQRRSDAPGVDIRELKLNNNWRARYARLLEFYDPAFAGFFARRSRRAEGFAE